MRTETALDQIANALATIDVEPTDKNVALFLAEIEAHGWALVRPGRPAVQFHPSMLSGSAAIQGTRIRPELAAEYCLAYGLEGTQDSYPHLTRDHIMVALWYMSRYGAKRWRKRLEPWLAEWRSALWEGDWDEVPFPPIGDWE